MSRKPGKNEIAIVDAIVDSPGANLSQIARKAGLDRRRVSELTQWPSVAAAVRERLDRGDITGQATTAVGQLLANLSQVAENLATADECDTDAIATMLQLLAALTGTLERLSRAGVNLDAIGSQQDDGPVAALSLDCWARGARWAMGRPPTRVRRGVAMAERRSLQIGVQDRE